MINIHEVLETNNMIEHENLDVRTITMGISLLDCSDADIEQTCRNICNKIRKYAGNLKKTAEDISTEFGIPIVNKRVSITPISLVGAACCKTSEDYVKIAKALDSVAEEVGVNFLGGYSAVVSKGMTTSDRLLIESIPEALACTERICSSVNVGRQWVGWDFLPYIENGPHGSNLAVKVIGTGQCHERTVTCFKPELLDIPRKHK